MKIKILRDDLLRSVQIVQNVVSTQSTLPILSNLLMNVKENKVHLTTTDLDLGVSCAVDVRTEEDGAVTIPAKKFSDIIRELSGDEVDIVVKKNNSTHIKSEQAYFKLMGISKDEFPKLPAFENKEFIIIPQAVLKNMLDKTAFAISKDEARYILNGILLEVEEGVIRVVSTDGRRLALVKKKQDLPQGFKKKAVIPIKTVYELSRNLSIRGEVRVIFSDNQICFEFNGITITSRLIEGEFPDYTQVIPKPLKDKVRVNKKNFSRAIKRVALFTNPDSKAIKMDILKNKMILSKNTPDLGEAKDELDIEYGGNEMSIGFNPSYLLDVLKVLDDEMVSLEVAEPQKPAVIRSGDENIFIVLPMQLV